jgi:predicted secreted protein
MASEAIDAQGIVIARGSGTGSPETFVTIPGIKSFSGPGGSASVIDVTDLQSTAKEKRVGLQDEGQLTLNINYTPDNAVHMGLRADLAAQTLRNFKMTFTDDGDTTWSFAAFVTGFPVQGGVDAVVEASVTLEISGAITES